MSDSSEPTLCDRCGRELWPGRGEFYLVRIEAMADPSPPDLSEYADMTAQEVNEEIDELLGEMTDMSERDLMDQVVRRVAITLCGPCYRQWIENPAGR